MAQRDRALDTLLELDEQVLVIDEAGYWVRFVVHEVPVSPAKPHGLDYSLSLHAPDGSRLIGFDNAHPARGARSKARDHRHRLHSVQPYEYEDAASLVADFRAEVESVLKGRGVWR